MPNAAWWDTARWHLAERAEAAEVGYECLTEMMMPVEEKTYGNQMGGIVVVGWE